MSSYRSHVGRITALAALIAVASQAYGQGVKSIPMGGAASAAAAATAPATAPDSLAVPPSAIAKVRARDGSALGLGIGGSGNTAVPAGTPIPSPYGGGGAQGEGLAGMALDKVAPLTNEEVLWLRKSLQGREDANTQSISGPTAKPVTTVYTLDLSPGSTPPVIRISPQQGAVVTFLDAAGRPWPATVAHSFGDKVIAVESFTEHQISVGLKTRDPVNAGIAVALKGLPNAIVLTVLSGQTETDRVVTLVVPRYLDNSPPGVGMVKGEPALPVGDLMNFLLRTPPTTAIKLEVEGLEDALAWQISSSRMVIRTKALVVSGYFRSQGLGDGTAVYETQLSPSIRVAQDGVLKVVHLTGLQVSEASKK
jgi:intracellular multiplication protein IcmK